MKKSTLALALGVVTALAWQDAFTRLNVPRADFEQRLKSYLNQEIGASQLATPGIGARATMAFRALDEGTKVAVVKELAAAAKAFVMSPAFQSAYASTLKSQRNAVNHGLAVTEADPEAANKVASAQKGGLSPADVEMRQQFRETYLDMLKTADQMSADNVEEFASTLLTQANMIPPRNATEKTQQDKGLALIKQAQAEAQKNLASARQKFKTGVPLVIFSVSDAGVGADVDYAKVEQQRNYNRYALRPGLKKLIDNWVATAKTVDFKAATQMKGDRKVFSNPSYENKPNAWKWLYRLGPNLTNVLIQFGSAWSAEL